MKRRPLDAAPLPPAHLVRSRLNRLRAYGKRMFFAAVLLGSFSYSVHRCTSSPSRPLLTAHDYVDGSHNDAQRKQVAPYLARLHEKARAHLRALHATRPHGLDPLFEVLLYRVDYRLELVSNQNVDRMRFDIAFATASNPETGDYVAEALGDPDRCASALSAPFERATNSDVVEVVTRDDRLGIPPILKLDWEVRPDRESHTVIAKGTYEVVAWGVVVARESFEMRSRAMVTSSDVGPAILDELCDRIGVQIVEHLTGASPPALTSR